MENTLTVPLHCSFRLRSRSFPEHLTVPPHHFLALRRSFTQRTQKQSYPCFKTIFKPCRRKPMDVPTNTPHTFGDAHYDSDERKATILDVLREAPKADPDRKIPTVSRLLQAEGANIIVFTFTPGQILNDHKAAHPVTIQCLKGSLDVECPDQTVRLTPGKVLHLPQRVIHKVSSPSEASSEAILLLTMMTGQN
ncbi:Cupin [Corynebacterium pseudotuberculosis]|nr:Cupin [Corynebacterium pseudotuberculosis]ATV80403.1 Cupin domain-containing protein [Corynebacterium pseudotuberculosis]AUY60780.1 cupin [Corynebacterium pseudotuberculosis]